MEVSGQRHAPAALLPPGKGPSVPNVQEAGWARQPVRTQESKVKVKQSLYTSWRRLEGRRYSSYSFLTSALDGGDWSASRPGRAFTPGERTLGTHCTGGWVGPRACLDTEAAGKILCLHRESNPDRPVVQHVVRHYTA
jgi:hypothetical protein